MDEEASLGSPADSDLLIDVDHSQPPVALDEVEGDLRRTKLQGRAPDLHVELGGVRLVLGAARKGAQNEAISKVGHVLEVI